MAFVPSTDFAGDFIACLQLVEHEVQFPSSYSWGAKVGPGYKTVVTEIESGWEQRTQNWTAQRNQFEIGHTLKSQAEVDELLAFFYARRGRGHSFRFKDWSDYVATNAPVVLLPGGVYQLAKYYLDPVNPFTRAITKPCSGLVTDIQGHTPPVPILYDASGAALSLSDGVLHLGGALTGSVSSGGAGYVVGDTGSFGFGIVHATYIITGASALTTIPVTSAGVVNGALQIDFNRAFTGPELAALPGTIVQFSGLTYLTWANGVNLNITTAANVGGFGRLTISTGFAPLLVATTLTGTVTNPGGPASHTVSVASAANMFIGMRIQGFTFSNAEFVTLTNVSGLNITGVWSFSHSIGENVFSFDKQVAGETGSFSYGGVVTDFTITLGGDGFTAGSNYGAVNGGSQAGSGSQFVIHVLTVGPSSYGGQYLLDTTTGIVTPVATLNEPITWSGEFDVPSRFDQDLCQIDQKAYNDANWENIQIIEMRRTVPPATVAGGIQVVHVTRKLITIGTGIYPNLDIPVTTQGNALIILFAGLGDDAIAPLGLGHVWDGDATINIDGGLGPPTTVDTFVQVPGAAVSDTASGDVGGTDIWYALNIARGITRVVLEQTGSGGSGTNPQIVVWVLEVSGITALDVGDGATEAAAPALIAPSITAGSGTDLFVAVQYSESVLQLVTPLQWVWAGTEQKTSTPVVPTKSGAAAYIIGEGTQDPTFYQAQSAAGCVSVAAFVGSTGGGGGSTSSYTINPLNPLTQPTETTIVMAETTATFSPGGATAIYRTRTFTIPNPPSTGLVYYVSIYDPTKVGDGGTPTLPAYIGTSLSSVHFGELGYIFIGSINAIGSGGGILPTLVFNEPIIYNFYDRGVAPSVLVIVSFNPTASLAGYALYFGLVGFPDSYIPAINSIAVNGLRGFYGTFRTAYTWDPYTNTGLGGPDGLSLVPPPILDEDVWLHWKLGNATTGVLTTHFPAHNDPDTTNDCQLDLSESGGTIPNTAPLIIGTIYDNLCLIAGGGSYQLPYEAIRYNTASGGNKLLASGSIMRGEYGIPAHPLFSTYSNPTDLDDPLPSPLVGVDHPIGSRFAIKGLYGWGIFIVPADEGTAAQPTTNFKIVPIDSLGVEHPDQAIYRSITVPRLIDVYTTQNPSTVPAYIITADVNGMARVTTELNDNFIFPRAITIPLPGSPITYYVYAEDHAYHGDQPAVQSMVYGGDIQNGGTGYAAGDTGVIYNIWGETPPTFARYVVDTVSGGVVTALHLSTGGAGYGIEEVSFSYTFPYYTKNKGKTTATGGAQPGSGSGLIIGLFGLSWGKDGVPESTAALPTVIHVDTSNLHANSVGFFFMGTITAIAAGGGTATVGGGTGHWVGAGEVVLSQPSPTVILLATPGYNVADAHAQ